MPRQNHSRKLSGVIISLKNFKQALKGKLPDCFYHLTSLFSHFNKLGDGCSPVISFNDYQVRCRC